MEFPDTWEVPISEEVLPILQKTLDLPAVAVVNATSIRRSGVVNITRIKLKAGFLSVLFTIALKKQTMRSLKALKLAKETDIDEAYETFAPIIIAAFRKSLLYFFRAVEDDAKIEPYNWDDSLLNGLDISKTDDQPEITESEIFRQRFIVFLERLLQAELPLTISNFWGRFLGDKIFLPKNFLNESEFESIGFLDRHGARKIDTDDQRRIIVWIVLRKILKDRVLAAKLKKSRGRAEKFLKLVNKMLEKEIDSATDMLKTTTPLVSKIIDFMMKPLLVTEDEIAFESIEDDPEFVVIYLDGVDLYVEPNLSSKTSGKLELGAVFAVKEFAHKDKWMRTDSNLWVYKKSGCFARINYLHLDSKVFFVTSDLYCYTAPCPIKELKAKKSDAQNRTKDLIIPKNSVIFAKEGYSVDKSEYFGVRILKTENSMFVCDRSISGIKIHIYCVPLQRQKMGKFEVVTFQPITPWEMPNWDEKKVTVCKINPNTVFDSDLVLEFPNTDVWVKRKEDGFWLPMKHKLLTSDVIKRTGEGLVYLNNVFKTF
jgi:hypothetical protein